MAAENPPAAPENAGPKEIKSFICELCEVSTTSEVNLQDHLKGAKHMKKFMSLGNNPATAGKTTTALPSKPKPLPNLPTSATAKAVLDLNSVKGEPLVGLKYIVEQDPLSNTYQASTNFKCELCEIMTNSGSMISHLIGYKHRLKYLEKYVPSDYDLLIGLPRTEQMVAIQKMAHEAEKKFGRDKIKYFIPTQKRGLQQVDGGPVKRMKGMDEKGGNFRDGNFSRNRGGFNAAPRYQRNSYERSNYNDGHGNSEGFHSRPNRNEQNVEGGYPRNYNVQGFDGGQRRGPNNQSEHFRPAPYSYGRDPSGAFAPISPDYPAEKLLAAVEKKFRVPDGSLGALLPVMSTGAIVNDAQAKSALEISNGLTQALLRFRKQKERMSGAENFGGPPDNMPPARNDFRRAAANNAPTALAQSAYNMHTGYAAKNMQQRMQRTEPLNNFEKPQFPPQEHQYHVPQEEQGQQYEYEEQEIQHGQGYSQYDMEQQGQESYHLPQNQNQYERPQATDPTMQQQYQRQQMPEPEYSSFGAKAMQMYPRF